MSEEIRKKIEDHARKELYAETNNGRNWMPTRKELQILTRIEAAEFGYQLAQEQFKKFTLLKSEPTTTSDGTTPIEPSQDELWAEVGYTCSYNDGYFDIEEAKKRYRITRL